MTAAMYVSGFSHLQVDPAGQPPKPDLALLTPSLRRGLSDVTRMFMHVAKGALERAQLPAAQMQVVFASAFGEIVAAERLMAQALEEGTSSPARFRHSVHNTGAGLFSISARSHLPANAIAAGWDTVAMGLLEAGALLAQSEAAHVLLVFAEEPVPNAVSSEHQHGPLAAAFVLSRAPGPQTCGRISNLRRQAAAPEGSVFNVLNHPLAPCVDLCRALEGRAVSTLAVGEEPEPWCVDIDARDAA
jgi:hypothetical protein